MEPFDIWFIEEPAVPGNIEVFKRLKEQIRIPLGTGEHDRTIWGFIPYLQERCIDILQPDIEGCGGVSQMRKIATLAETFFVPLAPHCATTVLGMTASLHVVASIPMFLIHEGRKGYSPENVSTQNWTVDKQGYASLPEGPGIGVEINDVKVAQMHADRKKKVSWPKQKLEDGSVADY
ncbi:MAG: enolase C-terminal domain-like protein [Pirellulaceae bacterium]